MGKSQNLHLSLHPRITYSNEKHYTILSSGLSLARYIGVHATIVNARDALIPRKP